MGLEMLKYDPRKHTHHWLANKPIYVPDWLIFPELGFGGVPMFVV